MKSNNYQTVNKYEWYASGNAPDYYPTQLVSGNYIFYNGESLYIPESIPFETKWGKPTSMHVLNDNLYPAPIAIEIRWLSLIEGQFYSIEADLPHEKIEKLLGEKNEKTNGQKYNFIVAGMAPYGGLAVWLSGRGIRTEIAWLQADPIEINMKELSHETSLNQKEYAESFFKNCTDAFENFQKNGMPDSLLFERYMQKFNYSLAPKFENDDVVFEGIEVVYYNGELNTTNSGEHAFNAIRAKPSKIVVNWSLGKTYYGGYFWTDETQIIKIFAKFYDSEGQNEGSFLIEIKESNKEFQFFLQNDSVSIEIPVEEMEFIIFKDKFEFHRSENYTRPQGGWRD